MDTESGTREKENYEAIQRRLDELGKRMKLLRSAQQSAEEESPAATASSAQHPSAAAVTPGVTAVVVSPPAYEDVGSATVSTPIAAGGGGGGTEDLPRLSYRTLRRLPAMTSRQIGGGATRVLRSLPNSASSSADGSPEGPAATPVAGAEDDKNIHISPLGTSLPVPASAVAVEDSVHAETGTPQLHSYGTGLVGGSALHANYPTPSLVGGVSSSNLAPSGSHLPGNPSFSTNSASKTGGSSLSVNHAAATSNSTNPGNGGSSVRARPMIVSATPVDGATSGTRTRGPAFIPATPLGGAYGATESATAGTTTTSTASTTAAAASAAGGGGIGNESHRGHTAAGKPRPVVVAIPKVNPGAMPSSTVATHSQPFPQHQNLQQQQQEKQQHQQQHPPSSSMPMAAFPTNAVSSSGNISSSQKLTATAAAAVGVNTQASSTLALAISSSTMAAAAPGGGVVTATAEAMSGPSTTSTSGGNGFGMEKKPIVTLEGQEYVRMSQIGKGGSSKVYRMMNTRNKGLYALKVVPIEDGAESQAVIESYRNEIDLLNKLKNTGRTYATVELMAHEIRPDSILILQELGDVALDVLIAQTVLQNKKRQPGRRGFFPSHLSVSFVRSYMQQMAEDVQVVHEENIVHGDLKPANFVLFRGRLKLIDFGIASTVLGDTTNVNRETMIGTLNYMSPESLMDFDARESNDRLKCGYASDVWSLGCILYQMIYGISPFSHLKSYCKKISAIKNGIVTYPPSGYPLAEALIQACLKVNPKERLKIPELLDHEFLVN